MLAFLIFKFTILYEKIAPKYTSFLHIIGLASSIVAMMAFIQSIEATNNDDNKNYIILMLAVSHFVNLFFSFSCPFC